MAMTLAELTKYKDIVIQCHDNPDADALASGYALKWYLKRMGIDARFVYGGRFEIQKSNLTKLISLMEIEIDYVQELPAPELLVNVDCQYGESNVTRFEAANIAVIDHHQVSGVLPEMSEVRSNYGSCSTVIYEMLKDEGIDINEDVRIATALYYGLMTDTSNFVEIAHPADRDLRDNAGFSHFEITTLRNSNLSKGELLIAGDALKEAEFNDCYTYGIVETRPCDPNILGIISDMLLEVDGVDTCLVYMVLEFGVKISVRSCTKEIKASELAAYLAEGFGGGGGHLVKAGGFMKKDLLEMHGIEFSQEAIAGLLKKRMLDYHSESEIIHAGVKEEDPSGYGYYIKNEMVVGYVEAGRLASVGSRVTVRTLEGDIDINIDDDVILILGVVGEVYPCSRAKFERNYRKSDEPYVYPGEYPPTIINTEGGDRIDLLPFAGSCIATGGSGIYARQIDHRVKIFTTWDPDNYYLGVKGDYMAVRVDDLKDIYIIAGNIFTKSYSPAEKGERE